MTTEGQTVDQIVYECWVSQVELSFCKLKSDDPFGVVNWLTGVLPQLKKHDHVHIVVHYESEYTP